jgi:hypothetical protein
MPHRLCLGQRLIDRELNFMVFCVLTYKLGERVHNSVARSFNFVDLDKLIH